MAGFGTAAVEAVEEEAEEEAAEEEAVDEAAVEAVDDVVGAVAEAAAEEAVEEAEDEVDEEVDDGDAAAGARPLRVPLLVPLLVPLVPRPPAKSAEPKGRYSTWMRRMPGHFFSASVADSPRRIPVAFAGYESAMRESYWTTPIGTEAASRPSRLASTWA